MMQLVTVTLVVLFVVPALLYVVALAARRYVRNAPRWISFPTGNKTATEETQSEPSAKRQA